MPPDPNWFYSSLAQSAAAVVGLLGAVLATRLQQQLHEVGASFQRVAKLLAQLRETLRSRADAIQNYIRFADVRIGEIEAALNRGETRLQVTQEVSFWGGSRSGSPWTVDLSKEALQEYRDLRASASPRIALLQKYRSLATVQDALAADGDLAALHAQLPATVAQGAIPDLRASIDQIVITNGEHRRIASIAVPATFVTILGWLCVFGLVGPLGFLSAYGGASKPVFLLAFAVGVIAIPVYIGFELIRIFRLRRIMASSSAT
jgi:hypothetical protein